MGESLPDVRQHLFHGAHDPGKRAGVRKTITVQFVVKIRVGIEMQDIQFIYQKNNTAEYRIRRDIVFKGSPETITFYIYFDREVDGIWRIRDF